MQGRLDFINSLISKKLWSLSDQEPIDFLYVTLVDNAVSEKDKLEFYSWIKGTMDKQVSGDIEKKIFDLFVNKICKDQKSCQSLSLPAFDSYLKVFLNINYVKSKLKYERNIRENKVEITSYSNPEELYGFEILWKIVFESFSNDIMNRGIEVLHSLYTVNSFYLNCLEYFNRQPTSQQFTEIT